MDIEKLKKDLEEAKNWMKEASIQLQNLNSQKEQLTQQIFITEGKCRTLAELIEFEAIPEKPATKGELKAIKAGEKEFAEGKFKKKE